ncbi:MAG TPA: response regulator transcription factor [Thermomicrobiales bacterium]|nr:response regulator transcription factor [Thermomicrobiales bacterium]
MAHIVIVEDERELAHLIAQTLREDGHVSDIITDGQTALDRLTGPGIVVPDLIILDLMLPHVDGLTICRRIRQERIVPIVMLTAKSTELDKVLGLELGADDYLTKPVALRELQARVSAILRRVEMMRVQSRTQEPSDTPIVQDGLRIDPIRREVLADGQEVMLTAKEFDLLYLLASHPGRVFSRNYLLDRLWGDSFSGFERTIDTHIQRLRRKLGRTGNAADRIVTLWGVGYKYERSDSANAHAPASSSES